MIDIVHDVEEAASTDDRPRYGPFDVLTKAQLEAFFQQGERTIERMHFPSVIVGRRAFYPWADIVEFLRRHAA